MNPGRPRPRTLDGAPSPDRGHHRSRLLPVAIAALVLAASTTATLASSSGDAFRTLVVTERSDVAAQDASLALATVARP